MNIMLDRFTRYGAIDVLTFIGQWPDRQALRAEAGDLTDMADRLGLRAMCVSHLSSVLGHDTRTGNEELFAAAAQDVRLWPFPIVNPLEAGWKEELDWAVSRGARGIRLVPGYHGYGLNENGLQELLNEVRKHGLPLQVCARLQDERLQHRLLLVDVVDLHELAELIMTADGHPLLISGLRDHERDLVMRNVTSDSKIRQVLFDLWFCNGPLAVIASICRAGLAQSYAYSSCTPLQTAEATALQLSSSDIGEEERIDLIYGNAMRLFK
ncbi:amidohydrolase family protein [Cohnella herbarum]|uniref:Amidohydrolase-related domain-containing protein n=1 Tax=Cohnella herbarum TaxID=2728023 RepID=A0A7Z2VPZ5_9BACL|nr:hypothetical protein [Cohnella herbarum]QJD87333.1 hypothetical protein HH215_31920 [Cohnella herbarum]